MATGFPQSERVRKDTPTWKPGSLCNLILEMTSPHFVTFHALEGPFHTQEKAIERRIIVDHLEVAYHKISLY